MLVGDESAAPVVGTSLKHLPENTTATIYIEVEAEDRKPELPTREGMEIHWVLHNGATHGTEPSHTVCEAGIPGGKKTSWFAHDVTEIIKELHRSLLAESETPKKDIPIPGYWRIGMAEGQWQSSKQEFNTGVEAEEKGTRT